MPKSLFHATMHRGVQVLAGLLAFLMSGLAALPLASAQSTVSVSIPSGAGASASAAPGFKPNAVTVVIGVNNTVTWTNNDSTTHTVTPSTGPNGGWSTGSGDLAAGKSYSFAFTVPGTYAYHCNYHSWMSGTVVVKAAASTSTSTSTSTTPEFPVGYLAVILFAVIAAVMLATARLRQGRLVKPPT